MTKCLSKLKAFIINQFTNLMGESWEIQMHQNTVMKYIPSCDVKVNESASESADDKHIHKWHAATP